MTSCLLCTSYKCDLFRCQLVLNAFWLHSHLRSQLSTCHIWLSGTVGAPMHREADSITALVYLHTHARVHILHAFRHTDEQRFGAIYRAPILAHHICQLLLSKWPRTVCAPAGKLAGKVARIYESASSQPQAVCVSVTVGCGRGWELPVAKQVHRIYMYKKCPRRRQ